MVEEDGRYIISQITHTIGISEGVVYHANRSALGSAIFQFLNSIPRETILCSILNHGKQDSKSVFLCRGNTLKG